LSRDSDIATEPVAPDRHQMSWLDGQAGQARLLFLGVLAALLAGTLI
jgi:hypothetical protein